MALYRCSVNAGGGGGLPTPLEYDQRFTTTGWINVKAMDSTKHRYFIMKVTNASNAEIAKVQYTFSPSTNVTSVPLLNNVGNTTINARVLSGYFAIGIIALPAGGIKIHFKEYDFDDIVNNS